MSALLLRRERDLYRAAPEFRYLAEWLEAEARAVFGALERLPLDGAGIAAAADSTADVVLLAEDDLLLTRRTLRALAAALERGAGWAAPRTLTEARQRLAEGAPVYTLRGYEALERDVLAAPGREGEVADRALPVALFRPAALAATAGGDAASWLEAGAPAAAGAVAGLCHQFIPYYGEARHDVLPLLPEKVDTVLEIGCGDGTTGEILERRFGCRVTGVELNPHAAAAAAARIHRVVSGDVQELELDGRYDLILALELFEHLTDQERFLARMRSLLGADGTLLLSVPNVGHGAIVEDLLAGRWDYLPIGLLCYTHYRFFTRATLASWFERCGFSRVRFVAQTTEAPERLLAALAGSGLEVDRESLSTRGFYVLAQP